MKFIYLLPLLLECASADNLTFSVIQCRNTFNTLILNSSTFHLDGLRGLYGERVDNRSLALGFTYETCTEVCGQEYDRANFATATEQMGIWFLPYFTLFAQIPLQAENVWSDVQVMVYSIGSPLMGLYSMFLSHFNWIWLAGHFDSIMKDDVSEVRRTMVGNIVQVIGKLQQFPVGPESVHAELLTYALLDPKNAKWWKELAKRLAARERHLDFPAMVQMGFAIMVYILSVIQALAHMGEEPTPLGMAIGNVFWWLIPLVWGWYGISTIVGRVSETTELLRNGHTHLFTGETEIEGADVFLLVERRVGEHGEVENLEGEVQERLNGQVDGEDNGVEMQPIAGIGHQIHQGDDEQITEVREREQSEESNAKNFEETTVVIREVEENAENTANLIYEIEAVPPTNKSIWDKLIWDKRDTQPDRKRMSPFYNFARCTDWTQLAEVIRAAYAKILDGDEEAPKEYDEILKLIQHELRALPPRRIFHWRPWAAFTCAFLLYGATTFSSFMIAYETVTVGLGCRSMGFLIYFIISIIIFLFLLLASHIGRRRHPNRPCRWETFLRKLGKFLSLVNILILFLNCLLQFTGVYYSCYCQSNKIGMGGNAHMIYPNDDLSANISRRFWWGGFGMVIGTSMAAIGLVSWTRWKLSNSKTKTKISRWIRSKLYGSVPKDS